jgi:hypothetical protein
VSSFVNTSKEFAMSENKDYLKGYHCLYSMQQMTVGTPYPNEKKYTQAELDTMHVGKMADAVPYSFFP